MTRNRPPCALYCPWCGFGVLTVSTVFFDSSRRLYFCTECAEDGFIIEQRADRTEWPPENMRNP